MLISRAELDSYDRDLAALEDAAEAAAVRAYDAMRAADPGASVAEVRDGVIDVVEGALASYGDAAAERACMFYEGIVGKPADMPEIDDATHEAIDRQARFAVGAIVPEDDREDI